MIAASFFSPLDPLRSGHLPGKPSFYAPDGLLRSAAGLEPTPGGVAGRFDGSSPDGGGAAVRFADGREMSSLYSLLAGILFIPSLALSLGVWTGSSKAFEVLSVLFWYLGPLNKVLELDYVGIHSTDHWGIYFFMSGILTLLAFTGRWRQIQGK